MPSLCAWQARGTHCLGCAIPHTQRTDSLPLLASHLTHHISQPEICWKFAQIKLKTPSAMRLQAPLGQHTHIHISTHTHLYTCIYAHRCSHSYIDTQTPSKYTHIPTHMSPSHIYAIKRHILTYTFIANIHIHTFTHSSSILVHIYTPLYSFLLRIQSLVL